MNKILVTGGAGFIGSNFIRYWLKKYSKDKIINLDKLTYAGHLSSTKDFLENSNYKFIKADICDFNLVDKITKDVDWIVHFAAESHVDRSIATPDDFIQTNVVGTHVLLKCALKNKIKRFHHVSTDEVFGSLELGSDEKFNEFTNYSPRSPYSASKAGSDHLVRAYAETYGLETTVTNTSNNFGPYQDPEKFLPRIITNLIDDKNIPIYGDGKNVRDWIFVEDHINAIDVVLHNAKPGSTYLVGGLTKDVNNLKIAKKIIKFFDDSEKKIEFVKDREGHDRRYAVDWSKIKTELGWQPKHDFDEWLERTIFWYKNNKWWWKDLKKGSEDFYTRKKTLK